MINNPTWAGPSLFIPVYMEALMVGNKNRMGDWSAVAVQYDQLGLRGGQPQPTPFQVGAAPAPGIHLIWTIPNAMRHGQVDAGGTVRFPFIPNRWIVTRSHIAKPGDIPAITAWILESDYLGPSGLGTHPYPDPTGGSKTTYIGRRFDIANWNGSSSGQTPPFLHAMGPGNASYSAIYDNMTNILAFHDDMRTSAPGYYSYSSCGWFSTPGADPMLGADTLSPQGFVTKDQWNDLMQQLQWTAGNQSDQDEAQEAWQQWLTTHPITGGPTLNEVQKNWPGQSICHGLVYNLHWQGEEVFYPINPILEGDNPPVVAIGANAAEAMAAWLAHAIDSPEAEDLLLAFQQDLLFEYARNPDVFYTRSHAARFSARDGGRVWVVIPEGQVSASDTIPGGRYTVPMDAAATQALTELNACQRQLDISITMLSSLKWQLYAAYWKRENHPRPQPQYGIQSQQLITQLSRQISDLQSGIHTLATSVEQNKTHLLRLITPDKLTLSSQNQPRYTARQDPVILLAGANQDTKFAPPGLDGSDNGTLVHTRFTGQSITSMTVSFTLDKRILQQTLNKQDFTDIIWPFSNLIPKEMPDYWFETFLLDTNNAQLLAQRAFNKQAISPAPDQLLALTSQIQRQQTLGWNQQATRLLDPRTITQAAGLSGLLPAKAAVARWTPPWTPVYLDWEVSWHPSECQSNAHHSDPDLPQTLPEDWKLGEIDFIWTGKEVSPAATSYSGRSILNGEIAQGLQEKLHEFLTTNPNIRQLPHYQVEQLHQMAMTIGQFDVLTQSLSGLIQQFIMQQTQMSKLGARQPDDLRTFTKHLFSDTASYLPAANARHFYPYHAGHFQLTRLQVVDSFGQVLRGSQLNGTVQALRSKSMVTPGKKHQSYLQLTPRITQSLRLDFRMSHYADDHHRSNSSAMTSAICGWILPNHLDHGLTVFDPEGINLGQINQLGSNSGNDSDTANTGLRWDTVPGKNAILGALPELDPALKHLNGFINGLLLRGTQGSDALKQLLDVIDSSLWKIDPLGQSVEGNLAILLGRPIALVRVLTTLELHGVPAVNQSWTATGDDSAHDFINLALPMRIGDIGLSRNGVMGYFLDDDYRCFYPYHGYDTDLAIPRHVITDRTLAPEAMLAKMGHLLDESSRRRENPSMPPIGSTEQRAPYLVNNPEFTLRPDGTNTRRLTLLVDPRGGIPAICGYLPVQWLTLPPESVNNALRTMFVTFRTGPVLLPASLNMDTHIQLPLPAHIKGKWTWVERSGVTTWNESCELVGSTPTAQLPTTRPVLGEGWLKLSGSQQEDAGNATARATDMQKDSKSR